MGMVLYRGWIGKEKKRAVLVGLSQKGFRVQRFWPPSPPHHFSSVLDHTLYLAERVLVAKTSSQAGETKLFERSVLLMTHDYLI